MTARYGLTPREGEILQWVCRGLSNCDICRTIGVRPDTLRTHIRATYRKLDCRNRVEAVLTIVHGAIVEGIESPKPPPSHPRG